MVKNLAIFCFIVVFCTRGIVIALSERNGLQPRRVQGSSDGDPITVFSFSPTPTVSSGGMNKSKTKGKGGSKSETKGSKPMGMKRAKKKRLPKTSKSERRSEAYSKVKKDVGIKGKDAIYAGKGGMDRTSFFIVVPTTAPIPPSVTDTLQPTVPSSMNSFEPAVSMAPTFAVSTVPSDVPSMSLTASDVPSSTPIAVVAPPLVVTRAPTFVTTPVEVEPTDEPSVAPVDVRGGGGEPTTGRRRGRLIGGIVGGIAGALVVGGGAAAAVAARAARRAPTAE